MRAVIELVRTDTAIEGYAMIVAVSFRFSLRLTLSLFSFRFILCG